MYIATCRPLPEPDEDEAPLLAALRERGVAASLVAWNDAPPPADGPVVLRSTWDYHHDVAAFLAWCAACPGLINPLPLVRWSCDKAYLLDLAAAGAPVVPTLLLRRGAAPRLADACGAMGWGDVVVKPAIGAASWGARRLDPATGEGEEHLRDLLERRDVLVQPYQPAVEASGERAAVWIAGEVTHCVRKSPRLAGQDEQVSPALPVDGDERAAAEAAIAVARAHTGATPLYGRVDLVRGADGTPRVMELELAEPSLFLARHPPALARFADALAALR